MSTPFFGFKKFTLRPYRFYMYQLRPVMTGTRHGIAGSNK